MWRVALLCVCVCVPWVIGGKRAKLKTKEKGQVINKTIKIVEVFQNKILHNFRSLLIKCLTEDMILSEHGEEEHFQVLHKDNKNSQDINKLVNIGLLQETKQSHVRIKIWGARSLRYGVSTTNEDNHNSTTEELNVEVGLLLSKDPVLWLLNTNTRDLIAKHGFGQNNKGDFNTSKRMYSDYNEG